MELIGPQNLVHTLVAGQKEWDQGVQRDGFQESQLSITVVNKIRPKRKRTQKRREIDR